MKSDAQLSLLARQWGATAVPFGLQNGAASAGDTVNASCAGVTGPSRSRMIPYSVLAQGASTGSATTVSPAISASAL